MSMKFEKWKQIRYSKGRSIFINHYTKSILSLFLTLGSLLLSDPNLPAFSFLSYKKNISHPSSTFNFDRSIFDSKFGVLLKWTLGPTEIWAKNKKVDKNIQQNFLNERRKPQSKNDKLGGKDTQFLENETDVFSVNKVQIDSQYLKQESSKNLNSLGQQKIYELDRRYLECTQLAAQNISKFPTVKPWILLSWFRCGREISSDAQSIQTLKLAIKEFEKNEMMLLKSPASSLIKSEGIKSIFHLVELMIKNKMRGISPFLFQLMNKEDSLDKNQKARLYSIVSEMAYSKSDLKSSLQFALMSQSEVDSPLVRDRIQNLRLHLNEKEKLVKTNEGQLEAKRAESAGDDGLKGEILKETASSFESDYEEKFKAAQRTNDIVSVIEMGVQYLKDFPGGRKSKWAQDKVLESYLQIFDQYNNYLMANSAIGSQRTDVNNSSLINESIGSNSGGGNLVSGGGLGSSNSSNLGSSGTISGANSVSPGKAKQSLEVILSMKERALLAMESVDSLRLYEWAKVLHRRLDLEGSWRLAEKSLGLLGNTNYAPQLLFIAGRSTQLMGKYDSSQKYFEEIIRKHSGFEDSVEAHFRLGLVHLRKGQPHSAVAVFEKLLTQKNIDKFELSIRYWLARSYQLTQNPKSLASIDDVISKYPFSYYGLKFQIERNQGKLKWPEPQVWALNKPVSWATLKSHQEILDRAEMLLQQGWQAEAQAEIQNMPIPKDPDIRLAYAKKFSNWGLYPRAIRLVNELTDLGDEYRSFDVVQLGLPNAFEKAIHENAEKNKLNPILVKSLIRQESAFGIKALSGSNAFGLMQIIPPTGQEIANDLGLKKLKLPEDMYIPENNIQMGTYYISKVLKIFRDSVPFGLAAYNAGPQRMKLFALARNEVMSQIQKPTSEPKDEIWFDELPWFETSFYVKAILRNSILYKLSDMKSEASSHENEIKFDSLLWKDLVR